MWTTHFIRAKRHRSLVSNLSLRLSFWSSLYLGVSLWQSLHHRPLVDVAAVARPLAHAVHRQEVLLSSEPGASLSKSFVRFFLPASSVKAEAVFNRQPELPVPSDRSLKWQSIEEWKKEVTSTPLFQWSSDETEQ